MADDSEYMLTTVDNPYNPYTEFTDWYAYDTQQGHHTLSLLARIAKSSDDISEADQDLSITQAIDEILKENVSGIHRKILKPASSV